MSFRRTLFLVITGVVLAVTGVEVVFDLAVDRLTTAPAGAELPNDLLLDLLDLPVFVAIAFFAARIVTHAVARPIERLTAAANELAGARRPESVPVPPGEDELSDLARAFNRMSASVHGSLERERSFTRYVSHELRTPLSALQVQIERAQMGLVPAADVLPALERQTRRMEEVLSALLALARSSRRELAPRPLAPLLEDVLAGFDDVEAELPAPLPRVRVSDGQLLQQAFTNLVDNAAKHASGRMVVTASIRNEALDLCVRDVGPGVPESLLRRLREPFVQGAPDREGSGLGLALVGSIAETLGGRLALRNVQGGFEATLTLPIVVRGRAQVD